MCISLSDYLAGLALKGDLQFVADDFFGQMVLGYELDGGVGGESQHAIVNLDVLNQPHP